MTAIYQGMHGTDITIMLPYLVVASTPTATPTVVPLPIVIQAPNLIGSYLEDENETDEEVHETRRQAGKEHAKAKVQKSDDKNGHHLVGVNSSHGIMDDTIKKKR
jgi:hypothetical protein